MLDPIIKRFLERVYRGGFGEIYKLTPEQMQEYLRLPKLRNAKAPFQSFQIKDELLIRCYTPITASLEDRLPLVIFLPANAYIIDSFDQCQDYCSLLANKLNMKIVNISHQLAPKIQFPHYLYECIEAIDWIKDQVDELQIQSEKIAIWGESSGGNVAAALTHLMRDTGNETLRHQTLIYPMVDLITEFPSKQDFGFGYLLDRIFIEYLADKVLSNKQYRSHVLMSPLLATNFSKLPPATIITAECDPLRDEGESYAEKLGSANVKVQSKRYSGMVHGFLRFYDKIQAANEAVDFACDALKTAFDHND